MNENLNSTLNEHSLSIANPFTTAEKTFYSLVSATAGKFL